MSDLVITGTQEGYGTTMGSLRSDVDNLAGLDLETDERDRLINSAYHELCVRGEWCRARLEFGPGVAGQQDYPIPDGVSRLLTVSVGGVPYTHGSEDEYEHLIAGNLRLTGPGGLFWLQHTEDGVEELSVYPTPGEGVPIQVLVITAPTPLEEDADTPSVPEEYRSAILDWVCAYEQGYQEDELDRRTFYQQEFERKVAGLKALRLSRGGRGTAQIKIAGIHF